MVWNSSSQDCKALQRVACLAERISGSALPSLQDIYINAAEAELSKSPRTQITLETVYSLCCHLVSASAAWWQKLRDSGGASSPGHQAPEFKLNWTQPLNIMMTSLTNHSQSVIYSHSLSSTSYWQCHLHTILSFAHITFCILLSYHILYLFFCDCCSCHHVLPVCTSPPPPYSLILIFNSTAYCHAHSLILYILYSVLYILFFIHFILCILPLLYSTIFALSMERTWFTFHCWLYNLCIVVYVTNKTWNLKLEYISWIHKCHGCALDGIQW